MTVLNESIPLAKISEKARQITFTKTVVTIIAFLFYAIGWTASKLWLALVWCVVAICVGFNEGKSAKGRNERTG